MEATTGVLELPSASIHYETHGTGPLLLFIPGMTGSAAIFAGLIPLLAPKYRVATYDRRGFCRSTIKDSDSDSDSGEDEINPERIINTNARDAIALIKLLSPTEPAIVFSTSGGCPIALELMNLQPALVSELILHEPVLLSIMPPELYEMKTKCHATVRNTFKKHGTAGATRVFLPMIINASERKDMKRTPIAQAAAVTMAESLTFFLAKELDAVVGFPFHADPLQAARIPIHLVKGVESTSEFTVSPVVEISKILGLPVSTFPGGHMGYATYPEGFGIGLLKVLRGERALL